MHRLDGAARGRLPVQRSEMRSRHWTSHQVDLESLVAECDCLLAGTDPKCIVGAAGPCEQGELPAGGCPEVLGPMKAGPTYKACAGT